MHPSRNARFRLHPIPVVALLRLDHDRSKVQRRQDLVLRPRPLTDVGSRDRNDPGRSHGWRQLVAALGLDEEADRAIGVVNGRGVVLVLHEFVGGFDLRSHLRGAERVQFFGVLDIDPLEQKLGLGYGRDR